MLQQDEFLSLSKMNFGLSEEQSLVLDQVDRVCKSIRPVEDKCYLQHRFNDRVGPAFGQAHLLGLPISKSFGSPALQMPKPVADTTQNIAASGEYYGTTKRFAAGTQPHETPRN